MFNRLYLLIFLITGLLFAHICLPLQAISSRKPNNKPNPPAVVVSANQQPVSPLASQGSRIQKLLKYKILLLGIPAAGIIALLIYSFKKQNSKEISPDSLQSDQKKIPTSNPANQPSSDTAQPKKSGGFFGLFKTDNASPDKEKKRLEKEKKRLAKLKKEEEQRLKKEQRDADERKTTEENTFSSDTSSYQSKSGSASDFLKERPQQQNKRAPTPKKRGILKNSDESSQKEKKNIRHRDTASVYDYSGQKIADEEVSFESKEEAKKEEQKQREKEKNGQPGTHTTSLASSLKQTSKPLPPTPTTNISSVTVAIKEQVNPESPKKEKKKSTLVDNLTKPFRKSSAPEKK